MGDHVPAAGARSQRVRVIRFRRNFGQTAAFAAGFAEARGRVIVTSDGDLQNDPQDIPGLVDKLDNGQFDIVCGWRKDRKDPFLNRRLPSMLANRLISWATGVRLNDYGCSLKAFRAEVVKPLRLYGELHRFLPALASEMGVRALPRSRSIIARERTRPIEIRHLANDSRDSRPHHREVPAQLLDSAAADFRPRRHDDGAGRWRHRALARVSQARRTARGSAIVRCCCSRILLIFTGFQFITIGLLAELQARTYHESQSKPIYVIREIRQADDSARPAATRAGAPRPSHDHARHRWHRLHRESPRSTPSLSRPHRQGSGFVARTVCRRAQARRAPKSPSAA